MLSIETQTIKERHPLAVLASRMPWQQIEASLAHLFLRQARAGQAMPGLDLFGEQRHLLPRATQAGRARVPLRIMRTEPT